MDPKLQKIVEAANTDHDEEHSFRHPQIVYSQPTATVFHAATTHSQHYSSGSSLQERFAYRGPQPSRQVRPALIDYPRSDEGYGEYQSYAIGLYSNKSIDTSRQQTIQQPFNTNPGQRAPRISLTPQSLHTNEATPSVNGLHNVVRPDPYQQTFSRASTLANLRTQPAVPRFAPQTRMSDGVAIRRSPNGYDDLFGAMRQATPQTSTCKSQTRS